MPELDPLLCSTAHYYKSRADGLWRRLSTSLFLVMALCLVTLIFTQRLATSSSIHLTIGRTIQSWSTNEAEMANITAEIEEALTEQRNLIAQEMTDYNYPAGKYNLSARSLKDLVPELGGRPVRSLVLTTWRSGSTFLGEVLNSHPGTFYHYEPLLDYDIVQIRGPPLAVGAIQRLENLLRCNYSNLEHYLEYGQDHTWLFTHNSRLWDRCLIHPHLCWLPQLLSPLCSLFPFQSMKTVRVRLRLIEQFLNDPSLNVRVLLLVRDPRGTMQSRRHRDWCPGQPDCWDPAKLCADLTADYSTAIKFADKYPHTFKTMRYEDLSLDPYSGVKQLFKFFGLDFHPQVKAFLDSHTKTDAGGVSSTFRNSKAAPFHWRQDLTHKEVRAIQRVCRPAMAAWGYQLAHNASHQRDFNPITKHFTLD
ncbi:carbohydrate sulfotransferase 5-like [Homalodisca vitripennis]|nr:carbohydrate sulfotransferase 5-like [Homalodisca vitripennis]